MVPKLSGLRRGRAEDPTTPANYTTGHATNGVTPQTMARGGGGGTPSSSGFGGFAVPLTDCLPGRVRLASVDREFEDESAEDVLVYTPGGEHAYIVIIIIIV